MHLVYDPVPLRSRLANDKATEQLVSLLGLFDGEGFLGLEGLVEVAELFFLASFLATVSSSGKSKKAAHLLPNFHQCCKGFLHFGSCSLLLDQPQNGDDMDKIFLVVPRAIGGHLELYPIGKFQLDLFCFPLLIKISWGNIRDGRPKGQHALLTFGVLQAFWRGLEA